MNINLNDMKLNIKDIANGKLDGKTVYICDLRYNDYSNKPIRQVKPTKVLIRSNSETNTRVYYSESHFIPFNKKDEPIKTKVIKPYDNTGYRSYTGEPLNAFDTLEECEKHYKKQVKIAIKGLEDYKQSVISRIDNLIAELK